MRHEEGVSNVIGEAFIVYNAICEAIDELPNIIGGKLEKGGNDDNQPNDG